MKMELDTLSPPQIDAAKSKQPNKIRRAIAAVGLASALVGGACAPETPTTTEAPTTTTTEAPTTTTTEAPTTTTTTLPAVGLYLDNSKIGSDLYHSPYPYTPINAVHMPDGNYLPYNYWDNNSASLGFRGVSWMPTFRYTDENCGGDVYSVLITAFYSPLSWQNIVFSDGERFLTTPNIPDGVERTFKSYRTAVDSLGNISCVNSVVTTPLNNKMVEVDYSLPAQLFESSRLQAIE